MAGITHLKSRLKKLGRASKLSVKGPVTSIVYMDNQRNYLWEEGVNYNPSGVLAVPLPMTVEEWEQQGYKVLT